MINLKIMEKIRPIYSELQGYLSQAPKISERPLLRDSSCWEQVNQAIEELNELSGNDYDRFRIETYDKGFGSTVSNTDYRNKLGGLIARLHGEFFFNEQTPFNGMPSTIIHQTQQQNQSVQVQILFEIRDKIDKEISKFGEKTKERAFLKKIKSSLSAAGNITELISLILKTAKNIGLTIEEVSKIF